MPIAEKYKDYVMHARLVVCGEHLMGSDYAPGLDAPFVRGNNFAICVYPDTLDACRRLVEILSSEGGVVAMPFEKQFFGYMGLLIDAFGVQWMITYGTEAQ